MSILLFVAGMLDKRSIISTSTKYIKKHSNKYADTKQTENVISQLAYSNENKKTN